MYMGIMKKMVIQVRKPRGTFGKVMAKMMNHGNHAKMSNWAFRVFPIKEDSVVLDIGCGGGKNLQKFAKIAFNGKIHGIDYSEASIETSKKLNKKSITSELMNITHGSVSSLPFEDNYFDLITGFECHIFWPEIVEDLKEVKRVLKPNSYLFLVTETYISNDEKYSNKVKKWAEMGSFLVYSAEELETLFQKAGYIDIEIMHENDKNWLLIKGKK